MTVSYCQGNLSIQNPAFSHLLSRTPLPTMCHMGKENSLVALWILGDMCSLQKPWQSTVEVHFFHSLLQSLRQLRPRIALGNGLKIFRESYSRYTSHSAHFPLDLTPQAKTLILRLMAGSKNPFRLVPTRELPNKQFLEDPCFSRLENHLLC